MKESLSKEVWVYLRKNIVKKTKYRYIAQNLEVKYF